MKKLLIVAAAVMAAGSMTSCGSKNNSTSSLYGFANLGDDDGEYVYICTGPYSKKYHKTEDCQWLGSCSEEIEEVPLEEAEDMGRTPCKGCY